MRVMGGTTIITPSLPTTTHVYTSKTTTRWKRKSFVTAGKTWLVMVVGSGEWWGSDGGG